MSRGDASRFLDALSAVQHSLDEIGLPWMCIGGVAVIAQLALHVIADKLEHGELDPPYAVGSSVENILDR